VQHFTMLVTPDGEWVLPDAPEFFAALGDSNPDYDAVAFAVKNLGFIKFQVIQHSIIEVDLHPRNVELPALLAAQEQILRSEIKLFRIRYFDTEWHSEISSSAEHAITRLSELRAPVLSLPTSERFEVTPKDISTVFEDEENPWRPLAQKWRVSFGQFDSNVISLAAKNSLLSRLIVIGVKPHQSEPIFRFIGDGHQWIGNHRRVQALGQKVEDMPDRDYGEWVSEYYKSVALSGGPRYDLVTASLQYQDEQGQPRRPVRYERLLLPWRTDSREIFLTMCSRVVPTAAGPESWPSKSLDRNLAKSS
jgi:hypothetical protein